MAAKGQRSILRTVVVIALIVLVAQWAVAAPKVVNPGFEEDRFTTVPGYAKSNGGAITGWRYTGNVGVNPWWKDPEDRKNPRHSFTDNGLFPEGRQVAFLQNVCTLTQTMEGFEKGRRYVVTYYENARHNNQPRNNPSIEVSLGGEAIVSRHKVQPVNAITERTLPFDHVESAVFTAPDDGAYALVFTSDGYAATVLIDKIEVREVPTTSNDGALEGDKPSP